MAFIGNTNITQGFIPQVDYFSGNGTTTAFTLSRPVASVAQVQAVIENVPQNPGVAFTVSGSTVTFTSAPPSGTNNIYVYYTSPITQTIAPSQGTVYPSSLSTGGPSWDTSGNVNLTGNITLNNGVADGAQLTLASAGFSSWNIDNYSGDLRNYYGSTVYTTLTSAGNFGIGAVPTAVSGFAANKFLEMGGASAPALVFRPTGSTCEHTVLGAGDGLILGATGAATATNNSIRFFTSNTNSSTTPTERMRIDSSGNLLVGTSNVLDGSKLSIAFAGSTTQYGIGFKQAADNTYVCVFRSANNTLIGSIQTTATSTSFVTSSDYRLKENIAPMTGALATVSALKPVTYTWKADGSQGQGFIAHELQAVVPDCVTGEKDAVDADGNPVYQGIDTSFLVATLTAAIQELNAKVTALEAQLGAK